MSEKVLFSSENTFKPEIEKCYAPKTKYLPSIFIAPQLDLENYLPDSLDGNFGFDSYSTALGADITSDAHSESNMSNISNVYYNNGSMRLD